MIPAGHWARMTKDWHVIHPVTGQIAIGIEGTLFRVELYVPADKAEAGFAFYHGTTDRGRALVCPAQYAEEQS